MIWTPPKRRAIYPRCDRCGRLKWSMGSHLSAVGAACCCSPCANPLEVTLSGIDGVDCTGCYDNGIFGYKTHDEASGIDGTYTICPGLTDIEPSSCSGGTEYFGSYSGAITYKYTNYSDSLCGSPTGSTTYDTLEINLRVDLTATPSTVLGIDVRTLLESNIFFQFNPADSGTYSCASPPTFGTAMPNQGECTGPNLAARVTSSGTATVDTP